MKKKKEYIEAIKESIGCLSCISLELDTEGDINEQIYNKGDMNNISLLFIHIYSNIAISHNIGKGLNEEQLGLLMTEFGKNIRQTILLGTGIDMHKIFDNKKK